MSERTYKVGDVVAWDEVPDGALVRHHGSSQLHPGHALRVQGQGTWAEEQGEWYPWAGMWPWAAGGDGEVTIIALDLTGKETAAELQRLAEVYEVREALIQAHACDSELWHHAAWGSARIGVGLTFEAMLQDAAERLHAAGWRPGDGAERATELLAAAETR